MSERLGRPHAGWALSIRQKSRNPAVNRINNSHSLNLLLSPCIEFLLKEEYWAKNTFLFDLSEVADVTMTANLSLSHT